MARRRLATKQLDTLKTKKREEFAKLIKTEWESRVAKRRVDRILLNMRTKQHLDGAAVAAIQSIWRGHLVRLHGSRHMISYIKRLQSWARERIAVQMFANCRRNVILIQASARRSITRKSFLIIKQGKPIVVIFL